MGLLDFWGGGGGNYWLGDFFEKRVFFPKKKKNWGFQAVLGFFGTFPKLGVLILAGGGGKLEFFFFLWAKKKSWKFFISFFCIKGNFRAKKMVFSLFTRGEKFFPWLF